MVPGGKKPLLGLRKPVTAGAEPILLPCQECLGCRTSKAQEWALRCTLELQRHEHAAFITLTYSDRYLPPTLQKRDLVLWLKRFRKALADESRLPRGHHGPRLPARSIRFFASGEYGETTQRPHYHALVFGARESDRTTVDRTWSSRNRRTGAREPIGRTAVDKVTPARVAYVAGYTQKKLSDQEHVRHLRTDPDTGESYYWVPPFIEMSRGGRTGGGIGGEARQHVHSWKEYAVLNGSKIAVPRYYHAAWKAQATEEEIEQNKQLKKERSKTRDITLYELEAREKITAAKQAQRAAKRRKI